MFPSFPRITFSLSPCLFCLCLTQFVSVSPSFCVGLSRMDSADIALAGFTAPLQELAEVFFDRPLTACALLHSGPFDVNGNSCLSEIWWKVSRPVFTPSQMALNKLGEKTQIYFSQKGLICRTVSPVSRGGCFRNFFKPAFKSKSHPYRAL